MMERDFVAQKTKEFHIKKHLESKLSNVGLSEIRLKKIPLGEKIIISTSRPSLIVGSKGANIKDLTRYLKKEFKLENPQIEIDEIKNIFLDANVVAEKIASSLERFGPARFKGIGHKMMENVTKAGALGVEINISGKIPGARAKSWRFYQGYLKKCGDISLVGVRKAKKTAALKSGIIGIKVAIMPPDIKLPDKIDILDELIEIVEEKAPEEKKDVKKKNPQKKTVKKKNGKKGKAKPETLLETESPPAPATPPPIEAPSSIDKEEGNKERTIKKEISEDEISKKKISEEEISKERINKEEISKKEISEEEIPSAEELVKETKERFGSEEGETRKRKEKTAEQLINEAAAQTKRIKSDNAQNNETN